MVKNIFLKDRVAGGNVKRRDVQPASVVITHIKLIKAVGNDGIGALIEELVHQQDATTTSPHHRTSQVEFDLKRREKRLPGESFEIKQVPVVEK